MIETSVVIPSEIGLSFQTFLRDTAAKQTEIIPISANNTWAFNEGLSISKGDIIVIVTGKDSLSDDWYLELVSLISETVGVVTYSLKLPPNIIVISRAAMEDAGQLDDDLGIEYSFLEYISRIIDHGWSVRFAPMVTGHVDSRKNERAIFNINVNNARTLVLKVLQRSFQDIPDTALKEVPALASLYYERGCFKEALRWISRLASRDLLLAQDWWQKNINEPGLSYYKFCELAEFLREDRAMERDIALGKMHLEQGHFELAAGCLASSIGNNPYNPEPYYLLGEAARLQNMTEDAKLLYSQALKVKPDFSLAKKQLLFLSTRSFNNAQEPPRQLE